MLHALLPTLPASRMKHHHAQVMLEVLLRGCNWGCKMVHSYCYCNMAQDIPEHPVHTDPKQPTRPSSLLGNHKAGGQGRQVPAVLMSGLASVHEGSLAHTDHVPRKPRVCASGVCFCTGQISLGRQTVWMYCFDYLSHSIMTGNVPFWSSILFCHVRTYVGLLLG
jgi:hypothetical protein